jgi:hypothetical protein
VVIYFEQYPLKNKGGYEGLLGSVSYNYIKTVSYKQSHALSLQLMSGLQCKIQRATRIFSTLSDEDAYECRGQLSIRTFRKRSERAKGTLPLLSVTKRNLRLIE